jgi:L-cysteine desulfidase
MDILREVLNNEVFPALGCTEPIAVAYCAAAAGELLGEDPEYVNIIVDPGVFKNGFAVTVPNTGGEKGNLIAGVMGALIRKPQLKMEILKNITPEQIEKAKSIISRKHCKIAHDASKKSLYIEVDLIKGENKVTAVIENSHTNIILLKKNEEIIFQHKSESKKSSGKYKELIKKMKITDLVDLVENIEDDIKEFIKEGVKINLEIAEAGKKISKVGHCVWDLLDKGYLTNDVFTSSKILTASAVDARMAGLNYPVMVSGGSGNQGIVAFLLPWNVGNYFKVDEDIIIKSIALNHLINSYIKCYTGDLSPLCGCAIASGVGAACAIVYQHFGNDELKLKLAVNTLISDLGGMLCDGAKGGCALKVASSTDSAIRSAYMAMHNNGITQEEGFVGHTAEETIWNLSKISEVGMAEVDNVMLEIMENKVLK